MNDFPETRFVNGMGWVVACRDAVRYVRQLSVLHEEEARRQAEDTRYELTDAGREALADGR